MELPEGGSGGDPVKSDDECGHTGHLYRFRNPDCNGEVYKVPVLKPVMDVLMALSKAFPMNLVLLIFI